MGFCIFSIIVVRYFVSILVFAIILVARDYCVALPHDATGLSYVEWVMTMFMIC